ncbi:unnamed protein product [Prorocentrum cordatum]|uniref:RNA-directed RNA polymerase n=1 Tax=Prorocentrum cordatum TaxID=2364126 RepID=A0ABN9T954_9DINO|nr:unnamed protein product [Polarella glacialis]
MQAAIRQLVGRIAEGASTGLVVWAGRPTCPACECSPVLKCPPLTCTTGDVAHISPVTPLTVAVICACIALLAFFAGRLTRLGAKTVRYADDLDATARVGDFCVVRYNVPGGALYHERLVHYLPLGAGLTVSITTPDGDEYEEVWGLPDIIEWEPLPNRQPGGVLMGRPGARYYRFRAGAMPTAASLTASAAAAAGRLGQPAPGGPLVPALGGRLVGPPAGGAAPGALEAGGAAAPLGGAPGAPAAAAAAAPGGVAPAAGLGGLVAALGGPAAGAPAGAAGAGGHVQDARVLPVVCDAMGNRRREFREAVLACREDQWAGWPVRGPRTALWVLRYIIEHGGTPTGMHSRWRSEARLQEHEPGVQEHERSCQALEELICYDQCNGANLAAVELLVRNIQVQQGRYRDRSAGGSGGGGPDSVDTHLCMGSELRRGKAAKHILDWGDDCIDALNDLYGHQDRPAAPANAGQRHAVEHVESRVRALGKPPPEAGFREGALRELLAGTGIYQTGDLSSRRPYVKESISWPSPDVQPAPLCACLGEAESEWLGRWQSTLFRPDQPTSAERAEFCPRGPFFDPSLFSKPLLCADFVAKLLARGMVELRGDCDAATVGCFFVAKKNNKLRVIFDTRYANLFFGRPARTALPTATALAAFENPGHDTYLASGDIDNAFYRLRLPDGLSSYFRLPALDASLLGITRLGGARLARGARVQPCVCVLPMGWSHALALCQGVLRRALDSAGFTEGQCIEDGKAGVVVDEEGALAVAGYVDNYAALGRSPAIVDRAALAVTRVLADKGLLTHDEEPAARDATFVGLELKRGPTVEISAARALASSLYLTVAPVDSINDPDKALENLLVDNPVVFDEAAVERARNAQQVAASTVQTFGLSVLESAAIRPNTQRQCQDRLATLVLFCRTCHLDWDSWETLDNAVTALLNHQFLDGKCSDLGTQLIAALARVYPRHLVAPVSAAGASYASWGLLLRDFELGQPSKTGTSDDAVLVDQAARLLRELQEVHSDIFGFGNFVMTHFTGLVEHGLTGPLFDQVPASVSVTHLVHGGDVGAHLGKRFAASLGRAVRLRSLLFLELFGGCGRVAASAQAMGYAALSLDINGSPLENHLTPTFLNRILGWIASGAIAGIWLSAPCSAWHLQQDSPAPPRAQWAGARPRSHRVLRGHLGAELHGPRAWRREQAERARGPLRHRLALLLEHAAELAAATVEAEGQLRALLTGGEELSQGSVREASARLPETSSLRVLADAVCEAMDARAVVAASAEEAAAGAEGAGDPRLQEAQTSATSPSLNQLIEEYKQNNGILDYEVVHDGVHVFHAEWDAEGVYFYQAFSDEIADYALQHQRFGGPMFNPTRMTWIKPSFAWVLYRSGYGWKDKKQSRVLKTKLSHSAVAKLLTWCQCKHAGGGSKGRVQWDPERDLFSGNGAHGRHEPRKMLRLRSIQIGLSRDLSQFYVDSTISIQDVTELANRVGEAHATKVHKTTSSLELMEALLPSLPVERPYLPRCLDKTLVRLMMAWPDDPEEKAALIHAPSAGSLARACGARGAALSTRGERIRRL